jgi:hypothetical protein
LSVRFNGQVYEDGPAMIAAAVLGACTEGDYCKVDLMQLGHCWSKGDCYATREEYVRQVLLKDDQAAFDKTMKVAGEIRSAIERKDTSIFR